MNKFGLAVLLCTFTGCSNMTLQEQPLETITHDTEVYIQQTSETVQVAEQHCDGEFISGQSHPCAGADFIEWGSGAAGWLYIYDTQGVESITKGIEFNSLYL